MSRNERRRDRIKEQVPILDLLARYGYMIEPGYNGEQQFRCDLHGSGQDNKPSARAYPESNSTYCIAGGEKILTARGWIDMAEMGSCPEALAGDGSWGVPVEFYANGTREIVRVVSKEGYSVLCTPDHEVFRSDGTYAPAASLKHGDKLALVRPDRMCFSQSSEIPFSVRDLNDRNHIGRFNSLSLPSHWSQVLGEALGYIVGDGWVVSRQAPHSGMVGLTSHFDDAEDARLVTRFLSSCAGGGGSEIHRTDPTTCNGRVYVQNQIVWTLGSDGMVEFLLRMGIDKHNPPDMRRAPSSLWRAPEEGVRGFLRGLFAADGSVVSQQGVKVNLYAVSLPLLRDVQLLLLQFGITCRVYAPPKGRTCAYLQIGRAADVERFKTRVGIANKRKSDMLATHRPTSRGRERNFATVERVEPAGVSEVFDITMPTDPSFVAGGIRVHNCFACDRTRDPIAYVMEKEGVGFMDALRRLEDWYTLPSLPWEDDDRKPQNTVPVNPTKVVDAVLDAEATYDEDRHRVERFLLNATRERDLDLDTAVRSWEAFDKVSFLVDRQQLGEDKARQVFNQLLDRVKARMIG